MRRMKEVACLVLSAAMLMTAPTLPIASAAASMPAGIVEECNGEGAPTAESVAGLIAQIGDVTLSSGGKIDKAATAYSQLDEASRALVPNVDVLTEAQQVFQLEQALEPLYIARDDIEQKTVIAPQKDLVKLRRVAVMPIFVYSDSQGLSPLRIVAEYYGDRWVFFQQIVISTDGESYTKSFASNEVSRDNAYGYVWEWSEFDASDEEIGVLQKMASAKKTVLRYKGKRVYDLQIGKRDKKCIADTLNAYRLMQNASETVRAKALAGVQ